MRALALTFETISGHTSTENKVQAAAAYLASQGPSTVAVAARFLAGTPLPRGAPATKVGRSTVVDIVAAFSGAERKTLLRRATARGDLGVAVAEILDDLDRPAAEPLRLKEVAESLAALGELGRVHRARRLRDLYSRATPMEAKYLTKLLLGSLRTGMQAARVEEALALAFARPIESIRRAHMLLGDIGTTAERAAINELSDITLRAHRPVHVMLASPAASADEVTQMLTGPLIAEHKYDGIRAQWHLSDGVVRVFSRALEDFTHFFPEIRTVPAGLDGEWILDGEVVAWFEGQALSFSTLQRRLGRKEVPLTLLLDAPVVFLAFDALRARDADLIDETLEARKAVLEALPDDGPVRRAPWDEIEGQEAVRAQFDRATRAGDEGSVFKRPDSRYQPGRRGRAWVKLKRPLGTLDVVVTGAEWGRGKRAGMLSDLIFAVRSEGELIDAGRAYSGLTDQEIRDLTDHFKDNTIRTTGSVRRVNPDVVLEVAFDDVQVSRRHPAGFALRFPRIVRWRQDLAVSEISTVSDLDALYRRARTPEVETS